MPKPKCTFIIKTNTSGQRETVITLPTGSTVHSLSIKNPEQFCQAIDIITDLSQFEKASLRSLLVDSI